MPEQINVAVLTPSTGLCRMSYAQSLARLVMRFAQERIFDDQPVQIMVPDAVEGSGIAENYERMVTKYLNHPEIHFTHFLSIEDDMGFSPECLHILARRELDIVGANYSTNKGKVQRFTAAGPVGEDGTSEKVLTTEDSTGVQEVRAIPQGMTLVSRKVYETLERPWFLSGYCPQTGTHVYQDYYFCGQAREAGFKCYVDHDVSKLIYHVGPKNYTWEDALRDERATAESNGKKELCHV